MANRFSEAQDALRVVEQQEARVLAAARSAFRQEKDPLRIFAESIAGTGTVHARAVFKLQAAWTAEAEASLQEWRKEINERMEATKGSGQTAIVFMGISVTDPQRVAELLKMVLPAILALTFVFGMIFGHIL